MGAMAPEGNRPSIHIRFRALNDGPIGAGEPRSMRDMLRPEHA
jgi:hypothetical protein